MVESESALGALTYYVHGLGAVGDKFEQKITSNSIFHLTVKFLDSLYSKYETVQL